MITKKFSIKDKQLSLTSYVSNSSYCWELKDEMPFGGPS